MFNQQAETTEQIAFREAGHSVMAYLITQAGTMDELFLAPTSSSERSLMLAEIESVTIKPPFHQWGTLTFSLRSLMTTAWVILAGYASGRVKYKLDEPLAPESSKLLRQAWNKFGGYFEEYGTDNAVERDRLATEQLESVYRQVEQEIKIHWSAVESVAHTLINETTLTRKAVYALIAENLPLETKEKVYVIENRTGEAERAWLKTQQLEMLDKLQEMMAAK